MDFMNETQKKKIFDRELRAQYSYGFPMLNKPEWLYVH